MQIFWAKAQDSRCKIIHVAVTPASFTQGTNETSLSMKEL